MQSIACACGPFVFQCESIFCVVQCKIINSCDIKTRIILKIKIFLSCHCLSDFVRLKKLTKKTIGGRNKTLKSFVINSVQDCIVLRRLMYSARESNVVNHLISLIRQNDQRQRNDIFKSPEAVLWFGR